MNLKSAPRIPERMQMRAMRMEYTNEYSLKYSIVQLE